MPSSTKIRSLRGLPLFVEGFVVRGYGRGSKQLGIPTANFSEQVIDDLPHSLDTGIYYGWANVDAGEVFKMVMSVGWNPFYKNTKKSMETHILHVFDEDFYGSWLKVAITGYIRPEQTYNSLEELIAAIHNDIKVAGEELEQPEMLKYKSDPFFNAAPDKTAPSIDSINNHKL
ncbi:riboflavin kinase-like [Artemia franciscana]|uniref:Riboflavin kinase n=1 Tax=Artemia franciscana TaxID=6661 RepID=A0AA88HD04_ARTSF|nr:hypothetical protein QYM36_017309 [Artemia franciscana]KAK2705217.1 hypothetical protein QYM36_017309 [Artemia franciscana]KAK2705218.1 hypothetical protein QYM36_017309 [Artemia franciscana]